MTTTTKRNEVIQFIRYVCDQVIPACIDVVNVEASTVPARCCATPAARSISCDDLEAGAFPSAAVGKVFSTAVVGMTIADHPAFRTSMRTKGAFALYLRRKSAELFTTLFAGEHFSRNKSCVSTFGRTVTNLCILWMKFLAAYLAGRYELILLAPFLMALRSAKAIRFRLLCLASWLFVGLATVVACQSHRTLLALKGASATAQENFLVVGLEFFPALGANLEHR